MYVVICLQTTSPVRDHGASAQLVVMRILNNNSVWIVSGTVNADD